MQYMKKLYKQILFLGIVLMFFSANGLAETMYVTDKLKLTLQIGRAHV